MTTIPLKQRITEKFGQVSGGVSSLSTMRVRQLWRHQKWVRTEGRFGTRLELRNRSLQFTRSDLNGEEFSGARLENCHFYWSDLRDARFVGAELKNLSFKGCDLEGADFSGAVLENVTFEDNLDSDKARWEGTVFRSTSRPRWRPSR